MKRSEMLFKIDVAIGELIYYTNGSCSNKDQIEKMLETVEKLGMLPPEHFNFINPKGQGISCQECESGFNIWEPE